MTGVQRREVIAGLATLPMTWRDEQLPAVPLPDKGRMLMRGQPYHAIGCNYFNALNINSRLADFQVMKDHNIPFARVNFGQFWADRGTEPSWRGYLQDKAGWFGALDSLIDDAETAGIGLIVTMFWRPETLPELAILRSGKAETVLDWGDRSSQTRQIMAQFTNETLSRYRNSSSLWGWEMFNEPWASMNHGSGGANASRVAEGFQAAFSDWARIISQGDVVPRLRSFGSASSGTPGGWTRFDQQYVRTALERENPKPAANVVSCHVYPIVRQKGTAEQFDVELRELIAMAAHSARKSGRPLFLGEFGCSREILPAHSVSLEKRLFQTLVRVIQEEQVSLAAVWDYGRANYGGISWDMNPGSLRGYQLSIVGEANARAFR